MKQKYSIVKNDKKNELIIREFVELGKYDIYTLAFEETYGNEAIESAVSRGKTALIPILRTPGLYPPSICLEKICESIIELYNSDDNKTIELFFNDKDNLSKNLRTSEDIEYIDEETDELDTSVGVETDELNDLIANDDSLSANVPLKVVNDENPDFKQKG
jgi:hypothetical protein